MLGPSKLQGICCLGPCILGCEGAMIMFLLDIIEVPESHSGATLAQEFQAMLERFHVKTKSAIHINFFCHQLIIIPIRCLLSLVTCNLDDTKTAELRKEKFLNLWNHILLFQPYRSKLLKWSSPSSHLPCVSLLQQPMMRHPFLNTSMMMVKTVMFDDVEDEDDPLAEVWDNIMMTSRWCWELAELSEEEQRQGSWGDGCCQTHYHKCESH